MSRIKAFLIVSLLFSYGLAERTQAQELDYEPKVLLVTAHPDDDAIFAATVFKTTHLLDGIVDLAIMTNGEGGYKYSTLGNYIYNRELDREEVGREYLPGIRKRELMAGGKIVGMRNYFFFDQVDDEYSEDISPPMENWDTDWIKQRLQKILKEEQYDFVFTMTPIVETHGHHKASAILALQAIQNLPEEERPLVFATTITESLGEKNDYSQLEGYPISKLMEGQQPMEFDRTQKFGFDDRLDYKIVANWVIAEHKSQGTMQLFMGRGNVEQYWPYAINDREGLMKAKEFFEAVNEVPVYRNPNIEFRN
ncbi:PIG-L domain-containing protein [Aliifodinibius salipaludis]|uniref:PIG-L domain-containing protein n=1 Tax=Fodinibius salipaludis TaxID=2032627 RepID=A0A2A2G7I1_9BACT|nr:PIG-L family deacetylase [Aliifodinibius salipaludis]PAU93090.1 PIG-L domain-containing protein [Aliifodinibius salipaludis]